MQLGLSTTTMIAYAFSKPVQLTECLGGRKNEKRTNSATLTKKRIQLFLYCCYKDWNRIN